MASAPKCKFCGGTHKARCPEVKSMTFFPDGETLESVTFFSPEDLQKAELRKAEIELEYAKLEARQK